MYNDQLDDEQMRLIKDVKEGHNILCSAPAGCGKTKTLINIGKYCTSKKILLIAYDKKLENTIIKNIKNLNISNVEVLCYYSLADKYYMTGANSDIDLNKIVKLNLEPKICLNFDLVLIDEVQDMTKDFYEFVRKVCRDLGNGEMCFSSEYEVMITSKINDLIEGETDSIYFDNREITDLINSRLEEYISNDYIVDDNEFIHDTSYNVNIIECTSNKECLIKDGIKEYLEQDIEQDIETQTSENIQNSFQNAYQNQWQQFEDALELDTLYDDIVDYTVENNIEDVDYTKVRNYQIVLIGDPNQSLLEDKGGQSFFLTDADRFWPDIIFKKVTLSTSYRLTYEIADVINNCISGNVIQLKTEKNGPKVTYIGNENYATSTEMLVTIIQKYLKIRKAEDIAILCPSLDMISDDTTLLREFINTLAAYNINLNISFKDTHKTINIENKVSLLSFQQAKGLEIPVVIIYGFDKNYFKYHQKTLSPLYVAITRASHHLILFQQSQKLSFLKNIEKHTTYFNGYDIEKKCNTKLQDFRISINKLTKNLSYDMKYYLTPLVESLFLETLPSNENLESEINEGYMLLYDDIINMENAMEKITLDSNKLNCLLTDARQNILHLEKTIDDFINDIYIIEVLIDNSLSDITFLESDVEQLYNRMTFGINDKSKLSLSEDGEINSDMLTLSEFDVDISTECIEKYKSLISEHQNHIKDTINTITEAYNNIKESKTLIADFYDCIETITDLHYQIDCDINELDMQLINFTNDFENLKILIQHKQQISELSIVPAVVKTERDGVEAHEHVEDLIQKAIVSRYEYESSGSSTLLNRIKNFLTSGRVGQVDIINEYFDLINSFDEQTMAYWLKACNIHDAITSKLIYRLKQINNYNWIEEDVWDNISQHILDIVDDGTLVHNTTLGRYYQIDNYKSVRYDIGNFVAKITGNVKAYNKNTVWEMKFSDTLTFENKLKLVLQAWMLKLCPLPTMLPWEHVTFNLFNIKTSQMFTMINNYDIISQIVYILVSNVSR